MTSERYACVNLASLSRHGTIEFRQHGGTTAADKIIAWVTLTQWAVTRAKSKGCRVAARMVGRWAEKAMFFWKAIDWINLTDPVVIMAKNTLNERFKYFKGLRSDGRNPNGPTDPRTGRPSITPAASLPMEGEGDGIAALHRTWAVPMAPHAGCESAGAHERRSCRCYNPPS